MKETPSAPFILLIWAMLQVFSSVAAADIYRCAEDEGEICISNFDVGMADNVIVHEVHELQPEPAAYVETAPAATAFPFSEAVRKVSEETRLDPALIHAVIATESHHNPNAVSPKGARGLMQLMPETARRFNVANPHDPAQNIRAGAAYLQELKTLFKGDIRLMLAAYNAGPGAVMRHGLRIPPYAETQRYVPRVLDYYRQFSGKRM